MRLSKECRFEHEKSFMKIVDKKNAFFALFPFIISTLLILEVIMTNKKVLLVNFSLNKFDKKY